MKASSEIPCIDLNVLPGNVNLPNHLAFSKPNTLIDLNISPEFVEPANDVLPTTQNPSINLNDDPEQVHSPNVFSSPHDVSVDDNNFLNEEDLEGATVPVQGATNQSNKKKFLSEKKKRAIFEMLLHESHDMKMPKGSILKVSKYFSVSTRSVSRIWHYATANNLDADFSSRLVKHVGPKRVQIAIEQIKDIPLIRRTNIRSLSEALKVPKSTLHRRIKEGNLRAHSNAVKPFLTDENKKKRLEFCLSMIDEGTHDSKLSFINMHDQIHIDEKWFYMSNTSQKYYLHSDEKEPHRTCKSKRYVTKLMFLVAVARPRFDFATNKQFDGKIGIWPLVEKEAAKRSSKNRIAGTMETKPVLSITKDVIQRCLIEKVLPSVIEKWPSSSSKTIFIQQDNAKPHLDINDPEFVEAGRKNGFDIHLRCQPPNSPDMNVLDLGFFRAIDSLQHQEAPSTIDEFIVAVENAYKKFQHEELNNVFLTLQTCMVEVMKNFGCNNYKIPHMNKHKLIRDGQLPECINCEFEVVVATKAALRGAQQNSEDGDSNVDV